MRMGGQIRKHKSLFLYGFGAIKGDEESLINEPTKTKISLMIWLQTTIWVTWSHRYNYEEKIMKNRLVQWVPYCVARRNRGICWWSNHTIGRRVFRVGGLVDISVHDSIMDSKYYRINYALNHITYRECKRSLDRLRNGFQLPMDLRCNSWKLIW